MIDIVKIQKRLISRGYDIGAADGVAGQRTHAGILAYVGMRPVSGTMLLGAGCAAHLARYGIMDNPARWANWLGQSAHESMCFRLLVELWGPTPAQRGYEGRADLGNTVPGDGFRYRGRGLFQITGRANYAAMGKQVRADLVAQPDLAADPVMAVQTACSFWAAHGLSDLADAGNEDAITKRINGGTNGIDDRRRLVARGKELFV
jgi:putative chitinase